MRFFLASIFLVLASHYDADTAVAAVGWAIFLCLWKIADLINDQRH